MKNTFNALVEAVQVSGKKFNEIEKSSIFGFLEKQGIPKSQWSEIYENLSEVFIPSSKGKNKQKYSSSKMTDIDVEVSMDETHRESVVDYSDSSHNDVKNRQPRKSVFSEIKKIAG